MPSAIAIRMYCENLLDISRTPVFPATTSLADLFGDATSLRHFARLPECSRCGMRARRLASPQRTICAVDRFKRSQLHQEQSRPKGRHAMNDTINRQILLVEKPSGKLGPEHFKLAKGAIPEPKDGEVLVRSRYISLDAANRAWMHGATYRAAVEANTVMAGGGIAEVVSSKAPGFAPGDLVFGDTGGQESAVVPAKHLAKMPTIEPMTHLLSVYGIAGLTAYFGLLWVGRSKVRENGEDS